MVCSADRDGDNVIDLQVLSLKMGLTPVAVPALNAVEGLFVFSAIIGRQSPQIGSFWNIGAVGDVLEQPLIRFDALDDQFRCLWGHINPYPLPLQPICSNEGGRTATERIKNHIIGVTGGFDDAFQQLDRLLRWIAGPFAACVVVCETGNVREKRLNRIAGVCGGVPF